MNWFVYIVECSDKTGSLYIGITNNLDKRLHAHNSNKAAKFTRGKGPVNLLMTFECVSKSEALKLEYRLKQLTREEKLLLVQNAY